MTTTHLLSCGKHSGTLGGAPEGATVEDYRKSWDEGGYIELTGHRFDDCPYCDYQPGIVESKPHIFRDAATH